MPGATPYRLRLLGCAAASLWLAGCIVVPIPTGETNVLHGRPVEASQLELLTIGSTTSVEIVAHFGQPQVIWEDARIWAYDWDMQSGVLYWAVGAYYTGAAGITPLSTSHFFLVEFDEADRVRRFSCGVRPGLQSYLEFLKAWQAEGTRAPT